MKKYSFLIGSAILLSLLTFYACQKDAQNDLQQNSTTNTAQGMPTAIDQVVEENYDKMVHTAALGIMELSKNPNFRTLVHNKCSEMFDGDYNVLLKDLKNPAQDMGFNMNESFANSISSNVENINSDAVTVPYGYYTDGDHINQAINGYDYYEKKSYIQIYVPNFENEETDEPNNVSNEQPIIVIYPEENVEDEHAYAYELGENGSFIAKKFTPDIVKDRLIWVISVNERVDFSGNVDSKIDLQLDKRQHIATERGVERVKSFFIKSITITDKKESGWGGRADVYRLVQHVKRINCLNSDIVANTGLTGTGIAINRNNVEIGKFGAFKLRKEQFLGSSLEGTLALFSFPIVNNLISELRQTENLALIIYESDNKKKYCKTYKSCSSGDNITYYSAQTPYYATTFDFYDLPDGGWTTTDYQYNPINDSKGASGAIIRFSGYGAYD